MEGRPMRLSFDTPLGDHVVAAERAFTAIGEWEGLMGTDEDNEPPGAIAFSRLFGYADDPDPARDPEIDRALARDPGLRADFRRLLERIARHHVPRLAAAAGGEITRRDGDGCSIRLETSLAEPDQTYVIIELVDADAPSPARLFIVDAEDRCNAFPLPPSRGGVIQLLEDDGSDLVRGLRDVQTEVFLR
jgi:hypothetical protein